MYDNNNNNVRVRAIHTHTHTHYYIRHINYTHLSRPDVAHSIIKLNGNRDGCGLMGWLIFRVEYTLRVRVCACGRCERKGVRAPQHKGFKKDDHHRYRAPPPAITIYVYRVLYTYVLQHVWEYTRFRGGNFHRKQTDRVYARAQTPLNNARACWWARELSTYLHDDDEGWAHIMLSYNIAAAGLYAVRDRNSRGAQSLFPVTICTRRWPLLYGYGIIYVRSVFIIWSTEHRSVRPADPMTAAARVLPLRRRSSLSRAREK